MADIDFNPSPESGEPINGIEYAKQDRDWLRYLDTKIALTGTGIDTAVQIATEAAQKAELAQSNLETHTTDTGDVHGATSEALANRNMRRDERGAAKVANPVNSTDAANKQYVENSISSVSADLSSQIAEADTKATAAGNRADDAYSRASTALNVANEALSKVGEGAVVRTETDSAVLGRDWQTAAFEDVETWIFSNYAAGEYYFIGYGTFKRTENLSAWDAVPLPLSLPWTGTAGDDDSFIMIVSGTAFLRTLDKGDTWEEIPVPAAASGLTVSAAYGAGRLLVMAATSSTAYYSDDNGDTWTEIALSSPPTPGTLSFAGNRFFYTGSEGNVYHSASGTAWTQVTLTFAPAGYVYGNAEYVAYNGTDGIYSKDLMTGTYFTLPEAISSLAYVEGRYIAITPAKAYYGLTLNDYQEAALPATPIVTDNISFGSGKAFFAGTVASDTVVCWTEGSYIDTPLANIYYHKLDGSYILPDGLAVTAENLPGTAVLRDSEGNIPVQDLDASKIVSGIFDPARLPIATTSANGALSAEDKAKLDGIISSAPAGWTIIDGTIVQWGVASYPTGLGFLTLAYPIAFTVPPAVFVSLARSVRATIGATPGVPPDFTTQTTTQFSVEIKDLSGNPTSLDLLFNWLAVGR